MSPNLIAVVTSAIGNPVAEQLSGILDASPEQANAAVGASIPALVGRLVHKAKTSEGVAEILRDLDDYDGKLIDNLSGELGSGSHESLLQRGAALLSTQFGTNHNDVSSIVGVVSRRSGLVDGQASSLLTLLAPIVMSVVGRQKRVANLDSAGLANMLAAQQGHIAAALPNEVRTLLGIDGSVDAVSAVVAASGNDVVADLEAGGIL